MKIIFNSALGLICLAPLFTGSLKAQQPTYAEAVVKTSPSVYSRTYSVKTANNEEKNVAISPKVMKHFNKQFSGATNLKWQPVGKNYLAIFNEDGATVHSLYNQQGQLIYTITYFSNKQLPSETASLVRNKYDDYLITWLARIQEDDRQIWIVKLSGQFHYKTVSVENGDMQETESFQKAN